jgi:hypothetical protein
MDNRYFVCPRGHIFNRMRNISEDGGASGKWLCAICDYVFGYWLDQGELDLGVVLPPDSPKFKFFDESFSETVEEPVDVGLSEVVEEES